MSGFTKQSKTGSGINMQRQWKTQLLSLRKSSVISLAFVWARHQLEPMQSLTSWLQGNFGFKKLRR